MTAIVWGLCMEGLYMERLTFHYDRHEDIIIWVRHTYVCTIIHVFCLPLKILGWFFILDVMRKVASYNLHVIAILNTFHMIMYSYTDFFTLSLVNYFLFNHFLYKSPCTS